MDKKIGRTNSAIREKLLNCALLVFISLFVSCTETGKEETRTTYITDGNRITGLNLDRYNNRPLYINNTNAIYLNGG